MSKVVLGFSGGVDSALSAKLLKEKGHELALVYLYSGNDNERSSALETASAMGFSLNCIDITENLKQKVCKPFIESYLRGETPNPCIMCNPSVKFKTLLDYAYADGAEYIATGHYARAVNGAIFRNPSENDQSYMLCRLTREQAAHLILPLGEYSKSEVRSLAAERGILSANKPDSMEICFIPENDYSGWIEKNIGKDNLPQPGDFIFHGTVVDRHSGIHNYTVGQRKSGLIGDRKVYISGINSRDNTIELSLWEELFKTEVTVRDFNWVIDEPSGEISAKVKVRHTKWENPECTAVVRGEHVLITCREPVRAPAPGQSAVLYSAEGQLLGGGFIT